MSPLVLFQAQSILRVHSLYCTLRAALQIVLLRERVGVEHAFKKGFTYIHKA